MVAPIQNRLEIPFVKTVLLQEHSLLQHPRAGTNYLIILKIQIQFQNLAVKNTFVQSGIPSCLISQLFSGLMNCLHDKKFSSSTKVLYCILYCTVLPNQINIIILTICGFMHILYDNLIYEFMTRPLLLITTNPK